MIVIDFDLWSAFDGNVSTLGTITIDNIKQYRKGNAVLADYRFRAYPKKVSKKAILGGAKPHRTAIVIGHAKHSRPVWELLAKGLKELGYENSHPKQAPS